MVDDNQGRNLFKSEQYQGGVTLDPMVGERSPFHSLRGESSSRSRWRCWSGCRLILRMSNIDQTQEGHSCILRRPNPQYPKEPSGSTPLAPLMAQVSPDCAIFFCPDLVNPSWGYRP
jgi:hypothetical protein